MKKSLTGSSGTSYQAGVEDFEGDPTSMRRHTEQAASYSLREKLALFHSISVERSRIWRLDGHLPQSLPISVCPTVFSQTASVRSHRHKLSPAWTHADFSEFDPFVCRTHLGDAIVRLRSLYNSIQRSPKLDAESNADYPL